MNRSKSLNYHYFTSDYNKSNNLTAKKTFENENKRTNPYSSVSILNNKKFYDMGVAQKYISSISDVQLKLIPRIRLPKRQKTFSKNSDSFLSQPTNKEKNLNERQNIFQDVTNYNENNFTNSQEIIGKVKFRDKKIFNTSKNNLSTRLSMENYTCQNSKEINQRKHHSVSQIVNYFNEFSDKNWNDCQDEKIYSMKNFEDKNQLLDEDKIKICSNNIQINKNKSFKDFKKCNFPKLTLTVSMFSKKNDDYWNVKKKESVIPCNDDYFVIEKNINNVIDKCNTNNYVETNEHIYEKVPDNIVCSNKITQKQHIPHKPFIRTFSLFPPDLTFRPRSFKSFLCKNTI